MVNETGKGPYAGTARIRFAVFFFTPFSTMSGAEIFGIVVGVVGLLDVIKRFVDAVRDVSAKSFEPPCVINHIN